MCGLVCLCVLGGAQALALAFCYRQIEYLDLHKKKSATTATAAAENMCGGLACLALVGCTCIPTT